MAEHLVPAQREEERTMKDFIQHALPWIIAGLMVALTMAHYARKK